jgi:hypothetical protein
MSARVLLATTQGWPFPAQLAGAFAAAGARVEALCPPGSLLTLSRHPQKFHAYRALTPLASLCEAMRAAPFDMILPCDDQAADLIARATGLSVAGRDEFLTRARAAGAPALESLPLTSAASLEQALARLGLPLVLKSDHSWGGEGVVICDTRQEARAAFQRLKNRSRLRDIARAMRGRGRHFLTRALHPVPVRVSAQRFVTGAPAISFIACWRGQLVGALHFDVLLSAGATGPASVIRQVMCPEMEASARAVAGAFNLSGLFGLDYMRDGDGRVHLLEMNARATPTSHLALTTDLPAALLTAARLPARPRPPVTDKREIALFPREWLRDPASRWLQIAWHDVPWDDPALVKACAAEAPPAHRAEAQALAEAAQGQALTAQKAGFRA